MSSTISGIPLILSLSHLLSNKLKSTQSNALKRSRKILITLHTHNFVFNSLQ